MMNGPSRDEVNAKIKANDAEVNARLTRIEAKIEVESAKIMAELHKGKAETLKWTVGLVVAMQAVTLYLYRDVTNQVNQVGTQVVHLTSQVNAQAVQFSQLAAKLDRMDRTLNEVAQRQLGPEPAPRPR